MATQTFITVNQMEVLGKAIEMKADGFLLTQILVTKREIFDIVYTFENEDYKIINLRLETNENDEIDSISGIFTYAYLYENEMKDLFGVKIRNINIDFKGNLYKTSVKTPFNSKEKKVD